MLIQQARAALAALGDPAQGEAKRPFFKNSQNDVFLGVRAASVHTMAKEFLALELKDIAQLLHSDVHEERSLGTSILCKKFRKADEGGRKEIFDFYIERRHLIRDWNGVDDSAPYIVGAYLIDKNKELLYQLALSEIIWDRRIAIVSTWWFIRHGELEETFKLAKILVKDREDLIHKAVGWMLREAGKRDLTPLTRFLDQHHPEMPRTMLRYAIEKFPSDERKKYLITKRKLS